MKKSTILLILISVIISNVNCQKDDQNNNNSSNKCQEGAFDYHNQKGCDGKEYPDPSNSKYILPFPSGKTYKTGLTNCSSSYHGKAHPDRYAFDFDMPVGDSFYATRGGKVVLVIEDQPSNGGGNKAGNWVIIDHLDNTYGIYLHSPKNGIAVNEGDNVKQGDLLGSTGRSGLAGYPHLHFIVVQNGYTWPYDPIPITFKNVYPKDVIIKSYSSYSACD